MYMYTIMIINILIWHFQAEDSHGEVMGVVKDANLFVASNYQGNPLLQYICFYCNKATLYHNGRFLYRVFEKCNGFHLVQLNFRLLWSPDIYRSTCSTMYEGFFFMRGEVPLSLLFRIFHSFGDVTITSEGLQITLHSWPLSSESPLTCHIYCDTGQLFIMVISEDTWHTHLLSSIWQWSCHFLFLWLMSVPTGIEPKHSNARQTLYH